MALLGMNSNEHNLWELYITEATKLHGQKCKLYLIEEKVKDLNHDPNVTYKDPIDFNILFESNPKPILKKMGWYIEDDDLPYVAYLTSYANKHDRIELRKETKISIPNIQGISEFTISDIRGSKINPLFWICKLVPYRYNVDNPRVDLHPDDYKDASVDQSRDKDEVQAKGDPNYKYFRRDR